MPRILGMFGLGSGLPGTSLAISFIIGAGAFATYDQWHRIEARFFPETEKPLSHVETFPWSTQETGLLTLRRAEIPLGNTAGFGTGGAIGTIGNTVIYASASGHIATVDVVRGQIEYSPQRVPMNYDYLQKNIFPLHASFRSEWYRVQDILVVPERDNLPAVLYASHHVFDEAEQAICAAVSEIGLDTSGGTVRLLDGPWREVYRLRECLDMDTYDWVFLGLEGGGKLVELDNEHILFAVGDYGIAWETPVRGKVGIEHENDFGKFVRINRFTGSSDIFANGSRNPQGLTRDSDGRIWQTEHGPQGGDEVNLLTEGADLGWPKVSLGVAYGTPRARLITNPVQGRHDGYDAPEFAFIPSVGLSAIQAMPQNPAAFALWSNDLLAASLVGQTLYRLRHEGTDIIYSEPINMGERIRDIALLENGWIALLGKQDRTLILLREAPERGEDTTGPLRITGYDAVSEREADIIRTLGEPVWGRILFAEKCSRCHSVNGQMRQGPPLNGVVNRPIGSVEGYDYSPALANANGKWSPSRLRSYSANPEAVFPETTMPGGYDLERWQYREIVVYLKSID